MTMAGKCHKIEKREEHRAYPKQTVGAVLVVELFSGGFPSSPSIRTLTGITVNACHNLHICTQLCGAELVVGCGCPFKAYLADRWRAACHSLHWQHVIRRATSR